MLGANPLASNGSLMTAPDFPGRLRKLRERGGRLVVVDPRRSETAAIADEHLFVRPGSDAYLLFALVHVLFAEGLVRLGRLAEFTHGVERVAELARALRARGGRRRDCGVAGRSASATLARDLAAAPRAAVYGRIGTCTQEFGTLASWLVDVLNVLTGNLDRPGGALFPRPAHAPGRRHAAQPAAACPTRAGGATCAGCPSSPASSRWRASPRRSTRPATRACARSSRWPGNPVLSTPNGARLAKALESLDFMVVDRLLPERDDALRAT